MRQSTVARLSRLGAFLIPTAVAIGLAACGNPVAPREAQQTRAAKPSIAQRVTTLGDSDTVGDSTTRSGSQPWW
jgi:hypothetical protein